jgi:hypothetical protein
MPVEVSTMRVWLNNEELDIILTALDFWTERISYGHDSVSVRAHKVAGYYVQRRIIVLKEKIEKAAA